MPLQAKHNVDISTHHAILWSKHTNTCTHACMHKLSHTHHHHLVSQLNNAIFSSYFTRGIISINETDSTGLLKSYRAGACLEIDCCTFVTVLCKHPLLVNLSPDLWVIVKGFLHHSRFSDAESCCQKDGSISCCTAHF